MKEHIIPYALKDVEWNSSFNITNFGTFSTIVSMWYYNNTGNFIKCEYISLKAGEQKNIPYTLEYGWVRVISSNFINITEFVSDSKSSTLFPINKIDLILKNVIKNNSNLEIIKNTPFITDICDCKYFKGDILSILEIISMSLQYKYHYRNIKKLEIIEGSSLIGSCPTYTNEIHTGGTNASIHYYTLGESNHTEKTILNEPIVSIWNGSVINNNLFDDDTMVDFSLLIKKIFPDAKIKMNVAISNILDGKSWGMYGDSGRIQFQSVILPDNTNSYKNHMYISFGNKINLDIVL
jgi:hypothetical protein